MTYNDLFVRRLTYNDLFVGILTLLCYLELHHLRWIQNLVNVYATCKVQCYSGPAQLQAVSKKVHRFTWWLSSTTFFSLFHILKFVGNCRYCFINVSTIAVHIVMFHWITFLLLIFMFPEWSLGTNCFYSISYYVPQTFWNIRNIGLTLFLLFFLFFTLPDRMSGELLFLRENFNIGYIFSIDGLGFW